MPLVTDLHKQYPILIVVGLVILWILIRGKREHRIALILLIITITMSDQLSSFAIKYWFARPRPCHSLYNIHLLVNCGSGFSFPSSHAVNNFAGALVLAYFIPRGTWWFFGFASTIAFSRVYIGVHYPLDVLGGGVIGLICAGFTISLYLILEYQWHHRIHHNLKRE